MSATIASRCCATPPETQPSNHASKLNVSAAVGCGGAQSSMSSSGRKKSGDTPARDCAFSGSCGDWVSSRFAAASARGAVAAGVLLRSRLGRLIPNSATSTSNHVNRSLSSRIHSQSFLPGTRHPAASRRPRLASIVSAQTGPAVCRRCGPVSAAGTPRPRSARHRRWRARSSSPPRAPPRSPPRRTRRRVVLEPAVRFLVSVQCSITETLISSQRSKEGSRAA